MKIEKKACHSNQDDLIRIPSNRLSCHRLWTVGTYKQAVGLLVNPEYRQGCTVVVAMFNFINVYVHIDAVALLGLVILATYLWSVWCRYVECARSQESSLRMQPESGGGIPHGARLCQPGLPILGPRRSRCKSRAISRLRYDTPVHSHGKVSST